LFNWKSDVHQHRPKNGNHLIRIKEGDESKPAIQSQYGLYEFLVMLFRLMNMLVIFQDMINQIFTDLFNDGDFALIYDIFIYLKDEEEYDRLVELV
jgi:hypothetical protein